MAAKQIESAKYTAVSRNTLVLASTAVSCALSIPRCVLLRLRVRNEFDAKRDQAQGQKRRFDKVNDNNLQ